MVWPKQLARTHRAQVWVRFKSDALATGPVRPGPNVWKKNGALTSNFKDRSSPVIYPTDLASFLELLRQQGDAAYSLIFAFAASHSLLLTLFAGYAASTEALDLGTLIAVVWSGSFLGDAIRFWVGRRFGNQWLSPFPRIHRTSQIVVKLVDRYYVWLILFHRYPHGIRGVAGFAFGMSKLTWPIFLAFNFVAAGLWSVAILLAGHAFGQISEKLMSDAFTGFGMLMLIVFLVLSWVLSRKLESVAERN